MIPMNASDSCLVLPLPRDTKDIGDLSDTIAYSGSMIRCYIELLRLFLLSAVFLYQQVKIWLCRYNMERRIANAA